MEKFNMGAPYKRTPPFCRCHFTGNTKSHEIQTVDQDGNLLSTRKLTTILSSEYWCILSDQTKCFINLCYRTLRVKRRRITEGAMVILGHFFWTKLFRGRIYFRGRTKSTKRTTKKKYSEAPNLEQVGLGQLKC